MNQQRDEHASEAGVQYFNVCVTIGPGDVNDGGEPAVSPVDLDRILARSAAVIARALDARYGARSVSLRVAEPGPSAGPGILDKIEQTGRELMADLRALAGQIRRREREIGGTENTAPPYAKASEEVRLTGATTRPLRHDATPEEQERAVMAAIRQAPPDGASDDRPSVTERFVVSVKEPGDIQTAQITIQLQRPAMDKDGDQEAERKKRRVVLDEVQTLVSRCIREGLGQEYIECDGCGECVKSRDSVDFQPVGGEVLESHCPTCTEKDWENVGPG